MGWNLFFWLVICFPSNIALLASNFYQVLSFHLLLSNFYAIENEDSSSYFHYVCFLVLFLGGFRFWFYLTWKLTISTHLMLHLGLTTSFFLSLLDKEFYVHSVSSLVTGSCFFSIFLLLVIMSCCKYRFCCCFLRQMKMMNYNLHDLVFSELVRLDVIHVVLFLFMLSCLASKFYWVSLGWLICVRRATSIED